MAANCQDMIQELSPEALVSTTTPQPSGSNTTAKDDIIHREMVRIISIEPGREFVEKDAKIPGCRFYRPGVLFVICFAALIMVIGVYVYSRGTGLHDTVCSGLPRYQLLIITWCVIIAAVALGVIGCLLIFFLPTVRITMNWLLRRTPIDHCELSDEDRKNILPECKDNRYLNIRLAGSAGDGFGCFFGQNGNIGLNKKVDFCQDLDLNLVFKSDADQEYSFQAIHPGFVNVFLNNKDGVLSDMVINPDNNGDSSEEEKRDEVLMSGSKVLDKMKSVLEANIPNGRYLTTPPAQRIEKDVNRKGKKHPIQYDYVFSLTSDAWPAEASENPVLQKDTSQETFCYVVPKPWADAKEDENEKIWRYSFTEAEAELFKHYNKHHKALLKCYIILKFIIKFEPVNRFPWPKSCRRAKKEQEIALKSYFLKTIFLHIAHELETRRVAEKSLLMDEQEIDVEEAELSQYHIYCDPKELETTLSNRISPLSKPVIVNTDDDADGSSNPIASGVFVIRTGDNVRLTPAVMAQSFNRQVFSVSDQSDNTNKTKTLYYDDIFVLILTLYTIAMKRRTLMHFFIQDLNLLKGFTEELCDRGRRTLCKIKRMRLSYVLDFQDFWGNRTLLHISYLMVVLALLILMGLIGVTIYGSVWLMRRDMSKVVCPRGTFEH